MRIQYTTNDGIDARSAPSPAWTLDATDITFPMSMPSKNVKDVWSSA